MLLMQTNETQIITKVWIRSPHPRIAQPRLDPDRASVGPPSLDVLSPGVFGGVAYHPAGLVDGEKCLAALDLSQRHPGVDLLPNVLLSFFVTVSAAATTKTSAPSRSASRPRRQALGHVAGVHVAPQAPPPKPRITWKGRKPLVAAGRRRYIGEVEARKRRARREGALPGHPLRTSPGERVARLRAEPVLPRIFIR